MSVTVTLTRDEMLFAAQGGCQRYIDALLKGRREYFRHKDPWGRDILGALAECAAAKHYGDYWTPCYENPHGVADLGEDRQIRSSPNPGTPLTVYETDSDDHAFLLIHTAPPEFTLLGWAYGHEAKQPQYWQDKGVLKPAFFVPQADLRPVRQATHLQVAA